MEPVVIVGGGLGGLAAAIRLRAAGKPVILIEKNAQVGGKAGTLQAGGFVFDTGPTLLTMPFLLQDLFASAKTSLEKHLELLPVEPLTRYFFPDGATVDIHNAPDQTLSELSRLSPQDAGGIRRFLREARRLYDLTSGPFLFSGSGSWTPAFFLRHWLSLLQFWRLSPWRTLDQAVRRHIRDPRLVQLFNRFATYSGSSPYRIPATFAVIAHVELALGGCYVRGGVGRIAEALEKVALARDVAIRKGIAATRIATHGSRVRGVHLEDGSFLQASSVLVNADALYAWRSLVDGGRGPAQLGSPASVKPRLAVGRRGASGRRGRTGAGDLSSSGFRIFLGLDRTYGHLAHHNIFFSRDYSREFDDIFSRKIPPEEPTVYASVSAKTDPSMAPEGMSNLYLLVNVPALANGWDWSQEAPAYRARVLRRLKAFGLEDLEAHIRYESLRTPEDLESETHAHRGALYGLASHGLRAAFLRLPARSSSIRGLYFAGGTTRPGGGIPLVLLSGKFAAEMILDENRN